MLTTATASKRRRVLIAASLALFSTRATGSGTRAQRPLAEVWKDPSCGCCGDWIAHLRKEGFEVRVFESRKPEVRQRLGMPSKYGSCHTAKVGDYVMEGHVPAREIERLLLEKPDAVGLAVPGMPIGSPGMDGPVYGNRRDSYDVLLVLKDGSARVYQSYR